MNPCSLAFVVRAAYRLAAADKREICGSIAVGRLPRCWSTHAVEPHIELTARS